MLVLLSIVGKRLGMGLRGFLLLASKFWNFVLYVFRKQIRSVGPPRAASSAGLTPAVVTAGDPAPDRALRCTTAVAAVPPQAQ